MSCLKVLMGLLAFAGIALGAPVSASAALPVNDGLMTFPAAADRTEVQRPGEQIFIALHEQGFGVVAVLYPKRRVALLLTEKGQPDPRSGSWQGVAYAVHTPPRAFRDGLDVEFGDLGTISGHFIPSGPPRAGHHDPACRGRDPVSESGHLKGRIVFDGSGGYLTVRAARAAEYVQRSFKLRCKKGNAGNPHNFSPGLFGYIEPPTRFFTSRDGTWLRSSIATPTQIIEFVGIHPLFQASTTFKAAVLEWLPHHVATTRWVEVNGAAVSSFTTGEPELHPVSAMLTPPFPFSGEATYSEAPVPWTVTCWPPSSGSTNPLQATALKLNSASLPGGCASASVSRAAQRFHSSDLVRFLAGCDFEEAWVVGPDDSLQRDADQVDLVEENEH
jgi:hypothetical protein